LTGKKTKAPQVLEGLGLDTLTFTEWAKRCDEEGISRATFKRGISELKEAHAIEHDRIDRTYRKKVTPGSRAHGGSNDD